jgi:hypothetical protein
MKVTLSDFILAVSDLVEVQSKELQKEWRAFFENERKAFYKTFKKLIIFTFAMSAMFFGFLLFLYGTYILLLTFIPKFVAIYIISFAMFVVSFLIFLKSKDE